MSPHHLSSVCLTWLTYLLVSAALDLIANRLRFVILHVGALIGVSSYAAALACSAHLTRLEAFIASSAFIATLISSIVVMAVLNARSSRGACLLLSLFGQSATLSVIRNLRNITGGSEGLAAPLLRLKVESPGLILAFTGSFSVVITILYATFLASPAGMTASAVGAGIIVDVEYGLSRTTALAASIAFSAASFLLAGLLWTANLGFVTPDEFGIGEGLSLLATSLCFRRLHAFGPVLSATANVSLSELAGLAHVESSSVGYVRLLFVGVCFIGISGAYKGKDV